MERVVHDVMEDIISLGKDYFCFWLMHHGVIKIDNFENITLHTRSPHTFEAMEVN